MFFRLSALSGILCGLFTAVGGLAEAIIGTETSATSLLNGFSPAFGLALLTGLYLHQRVAAGRLGGVGYALNLLGLALTAGVAYAQNFVLVHLDRDTIKEILSGSTFLVFIGSGIVFLVGVIVFGISMLRAGVFPKLPVLLYTVGFIPVIATSSQPGEPLIASIGHLTAGVGIVWLSIALWSAAASADVADLPQPQHSQRGGLQRA